MSTLISMMQMMNKYEFFPQVEVLTPMLSHIGQQFLNCLEGLMFYCLKTHDFENRTLNIIYRIFQHHKKCLNKCQVSLIPNYFHLPNLTIHTIFTGSKLICDNRSVFQDALVVAKRSTRKKNDDNNMSTQQKASPQNTVFKPENIWELSAGHSMLEAVCR